MRNNFKDKIPVQLLRDWYQTSLTLLLRTYNQLSDLATRLVHGLQHWLTSNWPRVRQQLSAWYSQILTWLRITSNKFRQFISRTIQLSRQWLAHYWPIIKEQILTHAGKLRVWLILTGHQLATRAQRLQQRLQFWYQQNWPLIRSRLLLYISLTRLDKPIGSLLLLWPTLWAVWIAAEGHPGLNLLVVFTLGVFLTRSAGCVFNDMADRKLDRYVRRTAQRPLTSGLVSQTEAIGVACVLLIIAFLLVLTTNRFTVMLSFVALPLAMIYPYMKRYTYIPQFFLGLAFSWGIPMAFAAQTESIPNIAWLLFIANILWSVVYDTMYAMVDREDDRRIGIKSTAILFDDADRVIIGILQIMFLSVLIIIGIQLKLKMLYYGSLVVAGMLMIYHQYLIRHRTPEGCFKAFTNNHWIGLTVLAGIYLNYNYD